MSNHFTDDDRELAADGILSGSGSASTSKLSSKPIRDGYQISVSQCPGCGIPNLVTLEWPEVVFISQGVPPNMWVYDQGRIRLNAGCPSCRQLLPITVTPDEATKWVNAAISMRFIPAAAVQQIAAQAVQARAGVR